MSLEERIAKLEALVQKQQNMLAKSGEQIMKLSIDSQRSDVNELDKRNKDLRKQVKLDEPQGDKPEESEYFTQDDVVQLVEELQSQLDLVDQRSQLRVENSLAEKNTDAIQPVPNQTGDVPELFPAILGEFEELKDHQILILARFYELLPPDSKEILAILAEAGIPTTSKEGKEALEKAKESEEKVDYRAAYNALSRYLGLRSRRA